VDVFVLPPLLTRYRWGDVECLLGDEIQHSIQSNAPEQFERGRFHFSFSRPTAAEHARQLEIGNAKSGQHYCFDPSILPRRDEGGKTFGPASPWIEREIGPGLFPPELLSGAGPFNFAPCPQTVPPPWLAFGQLFFGTPRAKGAAPL